MFCTFVDSYRTSKISLSSEIWRIFFFELCYYRNIHCIKVKYELIYCSLHNEFHIFNVFNFIVVMNVITSPKSRGPRGGKQLVKFELCNMFFSLVRVLFFLFQMNIFFISRTLMILSEIIMSERIMHVRHKANARFSIENVEILMLMC